MAEAASPKVETRMLPCPQCNFPIPGDSRTCPNCGVDLALLALLAERSYLAGVPETAPLPETPAAFVPRIGDYLMEQNLLTEEQLKAALDRQKELADEGERRLLGQMLVEMGMVSRETIDIAITTQIIELHAALQEANRTLELRVSERTAELKRALERLTELNQLKTNLISNVSHELRTPLAHIKGYVELLEEEELGDLTMEQGKAMSVIGRATVRLGQLIEDLIAFSTASREGMELKLEAVALPPLAREIVDRSKAKAAKEGIKLRISVEKGLPPVRADAEKLSWVVYQLVDNAIKFTPEGGRVRLWAEHVSGFVTIAISDTGIGIPASNIDEIFQPFHQLDGSATRRYGGTGLGLALVKQIVDAHGSKISAESMENKGSTFQFQLPISDDEVAGEGA
ncbi:MAG: ATP-binding protein [Anaerolineales bacterium]